MSFAGQSNSSLPGEAVEYAEKHNVFIAAAAGNSSSEQMFFPAAFETVISVGAIDADGMLLARYLAGWEGYEKYFE